MTLAPIPPILGLDSMPTFYTVGPILQSTSAIDGGSEVGATPSASLVPIPTASQHTSVEPGPASDPVTTPSTISSGVLPVYTSQDPDTTSLISSSSVGSASLSPSSTFSNGPSTMVVAQSTTTTTPEGTPKESTAPTKAHQGLSRGDIYGFIIGMITVCVLFACFFLLKRRRESRRRKSSNHSNQGEGRGHHDCLPQIDDNDNHLADRQSLGASTSTPTILDRTSGGK